MLYSQEQTGEPIGLSLRLIRTRLQALHDFPYSVSDKPVTCTI